MGRRQKGPRQLTKRVHRARRSDEEVLFIEWLGLPSGELCHNIIYPAVYLAE